MSNISSFSHTSLTDNTSDLPLDPEISFTKIEDLKSQPHVAQDHIDQEVIDVNQVFFGLPSVAETILDEPKVEVSRPIRLLHQELVNANVGLSEASLRLSNHKQAQISEGLFSQNFFTLGGSDTEAMVQDANTGKVKSATLWCVNHYTGLNRDSRVIRASQEAAEKFGTGAGTSAMSCGHNALHKQLEERLAILVSKQDAMVFPTGYTTNLGVISALASKKDLILFDRESHASMIDGIKLSGATFMSFRHNDVKDLHKKLTTLSGKFVNTFVAVESAYSMSGDLAPLRDITALKDQFSFYLYVDEAHTFGIYGRSGAGLCSALGVTDKVDFVMSTLSKSTASIGGFVACDRKYRAMLEWAANAYLFQAACSPGDTAAALESLAILENDLTITQNLHRNNVYMRMALKNFGFDLGDSQSPVIPIYIGDDQRLLKASMQLLEMGIFTVAVVYPAVKKGQGRLRFIVTARHSMVQIDRTVNALKVVLGNG